MSSFILKLIGVITMLIDHSGYLILGGFSFMNYIGRFSFPIFAFLLTEGYVHTSNFKKYFLRLLIFAIISQMPFTLLFPESCTLNILFSLTLGLLVLNIYDKLKNKILGILLVILSSVLAQLLHFNYGWLGIAIIFIFYIFKPQKILMSILFSIAVFIYYFYKYLTTSLPEYLFILLFCILSIIPINLYNGKKGKNIKYFLYLFYPLHLIVLYIIKLFI